MNISEKGIELIKHFEGFRAQPYDDIVGVKTVGYGHVIRSGDDLEFPLSEADATELLCSEIDHKYGPSVLAMVQIDDLKQCEFDSLCSFAYNLGVGALQGSTLLRKLNNGDRIGASNEFLRWNKAGGKVVDGLTRRRMAERSMFLGEE